MAEPPRIAHQFKRQMPSLNRNRQLHSSRNVSSVLNQIPDSLRTRMDQPLALAVGRVCSPEVAAKIDLDLSGSGLSLSTCIGTNRSPALGAAMWSTGSVASTRTWLPPLSNNYLGLLPRFTPWMAAPEAGLSAIGSPSTGVPTLPLPP